MLQDDQTLADEVYSIARGHYHKLASLAIRTQGAKELGALAAHSSFGERFLPEEMVIQKIAGDWASKVAFLPLKPTIGGAVGGGLMGSGIGAIRAGEGEQFSGALKGGLVGAGLGAGAMGGGAKILDMRRATRRADEIADNTSLLKRKVDELASQPKLTPDMSSEDILRAHGQKPLKTTDDVDAFMGVRGPEAESAISKQMGMPAKTPDDAPYLDELNIGEMVSKMKAKEKAQPKPPAFDPTRFKTPAGPDEIYPATKEIPDLDDMTPELRTRLAKKVLGPKWNSERPDYIPPKYMNEAEEQIQRARWKRAKKSGKEKKSSAGGAAYSLEKLGSAAYHELGDERMEKIASGLISGEISYDDLSDMEKVAIGWGLVGKAFGGIGKGLTNVKNFFTQGKNVKMPGPGSGGQQQGAFSKAWDTMSGRGRTVADNVPDVNPMRTGNTRFKGGRTQQTTATPPPGGGPGPRATSQQAGTQPQPQRQPGTAPGRGQFNMTPEGQQRLERVQKGLQKDFKKPWLDWKTKAQLGAVGVLGGGAYLGGKALDTANTFLTPQPPGTAYQYGGGAPGHYMNSQMGM